MNTMSDGRVQLVHKSADAIDFEQAELGILFMTDMFELSKKQSYKIMVQDADYVPMSIVVINGEMKTYQTGSAQFGTDLKRGFGVFGRLALADPFDGCSRFSQSFYNKILILKRGNFMFIDKARQVQAAGGLGMVVIGNDKI